MSHRDPVRAPLQPLFRVTLDGADDGEPGKVGNPLGSWRAMFNLIFRDSIVDGG